MSRRILATAALATAAALALPAAASATTVAAGTLRDAAGAPVAGTVTVFGWPHTATETQLPELGRADAGADGRYRVRAADPAQVEQLAAERGGVLDVLIQYQTAAGTGQQVKTADFGSDSGAKARAAADEPAAKADLPVMFPPPATTATAEPTARAAQVRMPCLSPTLIPLESKVAPTVIGELNNVYRDARANFAYGQKADSSFDVAFRPDGGGWGGGGDNKVTNAIENQVDINGRTGPYSRQITSEFKYVRYFSMSRCLGIPSGETIRAEEWIGGVDDARKQRGTLRVCPKEKRQQTVSYVGGAGFRRAATDATEWAAGVNVFGVGLNVKSGFSKWVRVSYRFGNKRGKRYYLCGNKGRSPHTGGRIFSGVKAS